MTDRTSEWVQQELASLGARVHLKRIEWATYLERRGAGAYDAAISTLALDPSPDLSTLLSSDPNVGTMNYGRFSDREIDGLVREIRTVTDESRRREACARLQRRLQDLEPVTALYHTRALLLLPPRLRDVGTSAVGLYAFTPGPRTWHWESGPPP